MRITKFADRRQTAKKISGVLGIVRGFKIILGISKKYQEF
jgi:hypothetical protein